MLLPDIDEVLAQYSPEQLEKAQEDWAWVTERWLPKTAKTRPELIQQVLESLPSEERLAGLKPEERLAGLKPEERLAGLTPEEELAVIKLLLEKQRANKPDEKK